MVTVMILFLAVLVLSISIFIMRALVVWVDLSQKLFWSRLLPGLEEDQACIVWQFSWGFFLFVFFSYAFSDSCSSSFPF